MSILLVPIFLVINISANDLCDISSWNEIKGDWDFDLTDCSLENTNSANGNNVWFGSADGLTPNTDFVHNSFRLDVSMQIHSGNYAGVLIRSVSSSTSVWDEGPSYYVALKRSNNVVRLGILNDGDAAIWAVTSSGINTDTVYNVSVRVLGNLYTVYLDGQLMFELCQTGLTAVGTIGLFTYNCPTTFYSLAYSEDTTSTLGLCSTSNYSDWTVSDSTLQIASSWQIPAYLNGSIYILGRCVRRVLQIRSLTLKFSESF